MDVATSIISRLLNECSRLPVEAVARFSRLSDGRINNFMKIMKQSFIVQRCSVGVVSINTPSYHITSGVATNTIFIKQHSYQNFQFLH